MKVLVIDDEYDIREVISISFGLRWPEAEVLASDNGAQGIEMAKREKPEVVILDIGLPDMDGFDACRMIRQNFRGPLVILTARNSETDKVRGLEMGADDYMTKPFSHQELFARVRAVLRRHSARSPRASEPPYIRGNLYIDFANKEVRVNGSNIRLPPVEYSLLYHLVKNPNRVLTYKTLLAKVWGREYVDQLDYLKRHVHQLRERIEDSAENPKLIVSESGEGFKYVEPE